MIENRPDPNLCGVWDKNTHGGLYNVYFEISVYKSSY